MFSTLISAQALKDNYKKEHWVIIDCRFDLGDSAKGEAMYRQGHIQDAQYLNLNQQLSGEISATSGRHPLPEISQLTQTLSQVGIGDGVQVVVYDDCSGAMAARAWWLLQWLGHTQVCVLDGGLQAWQALAEPLSSDITRNNSAHFVRHHSAFEVLSTEQICSGNYQLIDARAAARFRGEIEPIDTIAGHIPNALNRPFSKNLRDKGLFKSPTQLGVEFSSISADNIAHMCGSGVTACHNILAMMHAGLQPAKLYVGSWSEWIRDPARLVMAHSADK